VRPASFYSSGPVDSNLVGDEGLTKPQEEGLRPNLRQP